MSVRAGDALKKLEDFLVVLRGYSNAIIPHPDSQAVAAGFGSNVNDRQNSRVSIRQGIGKQVQHHLNQYGFMAKHNAQVGLNVDGSLLLLDFSGQETNCLLARQREVHRSWQKVSGARMEIFQQIADQRVHPGRRMVDAVYTITGLLVELPAVVLDEYLGERLDAAQRRLEIVGHGIAERLHLFVAGAQLARSLFDLRLYFPVEGLKFDLTFGNRTHFAYALTNGDDQKGDLKADPPRMFDRPPRARRENPIHRLRPVISANDVINVNNDRGGDQNAPIPEKCEY